jgi:hypothetical protein
MSSTTKRKVVTIRTTYLNIKELCIFAAEARVRTQASTWEFVLGNGTGFLTSTSVFICHTIPPKLHTHFLPVTSFHQCSTLAFYLSYHSTNAPHSRFTCHIIPPMLHAHFLPVISFHQCSTLTFYLSYHSTNAPHSLLTCYIIPPMLHTHFLPVISFHQCSTLTSYLSFHSTNAPHSLFTCHIIPPMLHTHFLFAYSRGYINVQTTAPLLNSTRLRIIT